MGDTELDRIHHAAYDRAILGISPDLTIRLNAEVLAEVDGPMLRYGLQEFHGQTLRVVPKRKMDQPDRDRLSARFDAFLQAG